VDSWEQGVYAWPQGVSQFAFESRGAAQAFSLPPPSGPPLRVIHIGQAMVRGGIESWLRSLIRLADPRRLSFVRAVNVGPMFDPAVAGELSIPVEAGGEEAVRRAAADADVLLVSGPAEVGAWLPQPRAGLTIFVAHGDGPWTQRLLSACEPALDHVIAVSRHTHGSIRTGRPVSVILNGIDLSRLAPGRPRQETRRRLGFGPRDFVVGSLGRFSPEKQLTRLVAAVAMLPPRFKLLLAGWGPQRDELLHLANQWLPGRFALTTADRDQGDLYAAMDAFCLPTASEGFGLATLEAMFCGLPVIVTNRGFAPEKLVDRVNALVTTDEPESLAAAAHLLLRHRRWARGLAREGSRTAESFGHAARMVKEYEAVLHSMWRSKHGG
jgi:glycosyltransferase involved in cell wall biosynthesis